MEFYTRSSIFIRGINIVEFEENIYRNEAKKSLKNSIKKIS